MLLKKKKSLKSMFKLTQAGTALDKFVAEVFMRQYKRRLLIICLG